MQYLFKEESRLTKSERKALHALLDTLLSWSSHVKKYLYWSSTPKWRLMAFDKHQLIGSLSVVKRKIMYKGNPLLIAGVGNVGIRKDYQGKGYAQEMLRYAENILTKDFDCALLFCDEKRTKLYEKVGYMQCKKAVTYFSKSTIKKEPVAMCLPLSINKTTFDKVVKTGLHIGRGTW